MAFEVIGYTKRRRVRNPASYHTSVSLSISDDVLDQLGEFARVEGLSKSQAGQILIESGLTYQTVTIPEAKRKADLAGKLAMLFEGLKVRGKGLTDVEDYYNNNEEGITIEPATPPETTPERV